VRVFSLPDLGEGLQEAEIVEWHVKPGDAIESDQAMVAVETDKAIVEVPAPYAGKVERLFGAPGDKIHVGAPLVGFEGAAADSGTIVGDLGTKSSTKAAQPKAAAAPRTEVKATPAVRALARSLNVDLASVEPSGPGGTVSTEDVKRAARGDGATASKEAPSAQRGMRSAMARNMAAAHQEVAAVTVIDDADVERWTKGTSALARLARAIIAAAKAEPGLNAWYDARADARCATRIGSPRKTCRASSSNWLQRHASARSRPRRCAARPSRSPTSVRSAGATLRQSSCRRRWRSSAPVASRSGRWSPRRARSPPTACCRYR